MNSKTKSLILISFLLVGFFISTNFISAATITKTLYAWAKDALGNISTSLPDSVTITLPDDPANTFYVSSSIGLDTNNGTSPSTPWKTIARVNSQTFTPGASILFKKGDTWTGETITVNSSGNSSAPITYSSYGEGNQPIISGFTTISGWNNEGGGVYSKVITSQSQTNMVTIDGVQQKMGRYPNVNWNYYESHSGTTQITDNQLTGVTNWTGAEIVLRTYDWAFENYKITNHTNNTLTFTSDSQSNLTDGWGYFIQNNLSTLDTFGEWYHDTSTGKFYMYFGGVNPITKNVQVSTTNILISLPMGISYANFNNFKLIGANHYGINMEWGCQYINADSLNIDFTGYIGARNYSSKHVTFNNLNVNHTNDTGIFVASWYTDYSKVTNSTINNTGLLIGQGELGFASGVGLLLSDGINNIAEYNNILNSGYSGIQVGGISSGVIVRNNYIDNYCINKTDGGGIYTGNDDSSNMIIEGNIILNGIGGVDGEAPSISPAGARGIYPDFNFTVGLIIRNNTVAHCSHSGIFIFMGQNIDIYGNTIYDCLFQWSFQENDPPGPPYTQILNITSHDNIFVAKELNQYSLFGRIADGHTYAGLGTFDNNIYARPIDDNLTMKPLINFWDGPAISLASWQISTGQDLNSHTSPITITNTNDILFDYNATISNKTVSLGSNTYVDMTGTVRTGSVTLAPYTSIILIKTN